jgi:hypothetical protein
MRRERDGKRDGRDEGYKLRGINGRRKETGEKESKRREKEKLRIRNDRNDGRGKGRVKRKNWGRSS